MNAITRKAEYQDFDLNHFTRELDRAKSFLFQHKYAAFYGPLLCSLNFFWTLDIKTAATDGVNLMWNPDWFGKIKLSTRATVLMHEVRHPAGLHFVRMGDRHHKIWNYACDIKINNGLIDEGFDFSELSWCWKNPSYPRDMPEEDIYDDLIIKGTAPTLGAWGQIPGGSGGPGGEEDDGSDMLPTREMTKEDQARAVNNVIRAAHQAQQAGTGNMPGDIETTLNQFLAPIVPWEQIIHRFMQDLTQGGITWRKPNRRFSDLYLPSSFDDEGLLEHLVYFEDTSGSISDKDALRFNSEFKYVKDFYKPKKMTLVQFDTIIQQVLEYDEDTPFDQVMIKGRGGTDLEPVRQYILKHRPTAAIVFSDLRCPPMQPLGFEIPIIWICITNRQATIPFGTVTHIR